MKGGNLIVGSETKLSFVSEMHEEAFLYIFWTYVEDMSATFKDSDEIFQLESDLSSKRSSKSQFIGI